jgi:PHD/YefM family antitoxin component YafN of YafNO toxin-antitoxin module
MAKPATVIPLADLTCNAASILRQLKESKKPALITQEGHPEAVLFSFEAYQQVEAEREILTRLAQGEREIALGEGYDLRDVLNEADDLLLHSPD